MKTSEKDESLKEDIKDKLEEKNKPAEKKKNAEKKAKGKIEKIEDPKKLNKNKIEKLQKELDAKEKEAAENYNKWLLLNAEFDNFKKRMQREKTDFLKYAGEKIIKDFLPILDDLERAIEAARKNSKEGELIKGIEMILNQIKTSLESNGARQLESLGRKFDPNIHEAISKIPTTEHENNIIMEEFRKGYMLHDRLLRPAMVVVADNEPENVLKKDSGAEAEPKNKEGKETPGVGNKDIKEEVAN